MCGWQCARRQRQRSSPLAVETNITTACGIHMSHLCETHIVANADANLSNGYKIRGKALVIDLKVWLGTIKAQCQRRTAELTRLENGETVAGGEGLGLLERNATRNINVKEMNLCGRERVSRMQPGPVRSCAVKKPRLAVLGHHRAVGRENCARVVKFVAVPLRNGAANDVNLEERDSGRGGVGVG